MAKTQTGAGRTATKPRAKPSPPGALTPRLLDRFSRAFAENPAHRRAQNAVTQTSIDNIALDRAVVTRADHSFSKVLDDWTATSQKRSGRCWLFAGLNLLRVGAMKKMNLKEFEFSQNHTFFWDKIERANHFLEAVIETADRPIDDRTVAFLLDQPIGDGGQWNMFVNVVKKHGLVPKSAMPETESSSNSSRMNSALQMKLREGAKRLREGKAKGASTGDLRVEKDALLEVVYRILAIHLGEPPARFDWQWSDKKKKFHRDGEMTPQAFAKEYLTIPVDEYVCLTHDPRATSPRNRTFTVERLGNVVGGDIVTYLNVDVAVMKRVAMRQILDGKPVWFGCDVGKMMQSDLGVWDANLYDYAGVYGAEFDLDKAGRLDYHQTRMTHAMLFTGVDVAQGRPRRWRVENSWGKERGKKGFYLMNDSWFDEYMFEIAAPKRYLPARLQKALALKPIVLPPWDPMGSLAGGPTTG